ncbi:MAG: hypothetical protein GY786_08935 [Proteobacteria bacterium]|nr:hypothetical protein [Pseudomonadota bacterium]
MEFLQKIQQEKPEILRDWYETVINSFPQKSRRIITLNEDRFANPMGYTLYEGMQQILETIVSRSSIVDLDEVLGKIIRVKAIQDKQPNDGLEFLFDLKNIIRQYGNAFSENFTENRALFEIEDLIDSIILKAHLIFVESREKISELKVREVEKKTHMLRRLVGEV